MAEVRNILVLLGLAVRYLLYRARIFKHPPEPYKRGYDEGLCALSTLFGWWRSVRVVNAAKCPTQGPAVFAGNHILINDPFVIGNAIYRISRASMRCRVMMRDDFFRKMPRWLRLLVDPDEVTVLIGAMQISRQNVDPAQLKPFIDLLRESQVFLIFPGRSRSRSGVFIEYRDWIRSPGATSFFLVGAQKDCPELKVPTVAAVRTYNPVTRRSALVFGKPMYLPPDADRVQQRQFDYDLTVAMSELIEINVAHVLSAWLYLHCLHYGNAPVHRERVRADANAILKAVRTRHVDPAAINDLDRALHQTMRFLTSRRMLQIHNGKITPNADAILYVPPFSQYRKTNPVRFLANQILHFMDVTRLIERAVLQESGTRHCEESSTKQSPDPLPVTIPHEGSGDCFVEDSSQ